MNQTADKHMEGSGGVGRWGLCRWMDGKLEKDGRMEMTIVLFYSPPSDVTFNFAKKDGSLFCLSRLSTQVPPHRVACF